MFLLNFKDETIAQMFLKIYYFIFMTIKWVPNYLWLRLSEFTIDLQYWVCHQTETQKDPQDLGMKLDHKNGIISSVFPICSSRIQSFPHPPRFLVISEVSHLPSPHLCLLCSRGRSDHWCPWGLILTIAQAQRLAKHRVKESSAKREHSLFMFC